MFLSQPLKNEEFRQRNPLLAQNNRNLRDSATTLELKVLANLEAYNAILISSGISRSNRYKLLVKECTHEFSVFNK